MNSNTTTKRNKLNSLPYPFIATLLIIQVFGLLMLFSASYSTAYAETGNSYSYVFDQLKFTLLGETAMLIISRIDYHRLRRLTNAAYAVCILLLIIVLSCAPINGCRRWLHWKGIPIPSIQVSEIAKFVLILMAAKIISGRWNRHRTLKYGVIAPFLPVIPIVILLVFEPHFSAIILLCLIVGTMLLMSGSGGVWTYAASGAGAAGIWFILNVARKYVPYVENRLSGWTADLSKMTYQTKQSLYAIGSGGLLGLGLGGSLEKRLWLPECTNDFIFSIICEELGFVGAMVTIFLFAALVMQGFYLAFTAKDAYGMLIGVGIMAQISWQTFLNIAVVTNSLPNTGISLPFFSSGGTSLVMLLCEIGVLLNIARQGAGNRIFASADAQSVVSRPETASR